MWHMVLAPAFNADGILGGIVLSLLFFIFTIMTISILVLMEGLSAFLHAIRLHWYNFQTCKYCLSLYFSGLNFKANFMLELERLLSRSIFIFA